jgi:hypothetical protein
MYDDAVVRRFWAKVTKDGPTPGHVPALGSCWMWTACRDRYGYGIFVICKRNYMAHRIAYRAEVGVIPSGMHVCHRCDNPSCVRPSHLFAGTRQENMDDMVAKCRQRCWPRPGAANPNASLTESQVFEIRKEYTLGRTQISIAKRYGISQPHVSKIVHGVAWKGAA